MLSDPYREFRQAAGQVEEKIDLGRAALAIALFDYPQLDIPAYLNRIDGLAIEVTRHCQGSPSGQKSLDALNTVLFERHGFRGNRKDYYDPKNSFLHEVLDRRIGIPITLSVLYIEVGQRVGLAIEGVGFPGHFQDLREGENGAARRVLDEIHGIQSSIRLGDRIQEWHEAYARLRAHLPAAPHLHLIRFDAINNRVVYSRQELHRVWMQTTNNLREFNWLKVRPWRFVRTLVQDFSLTTSFASSFREFSKQ